MVRKLRYEPFKGDLPAIQQRPQWQIEVFNRDRGCIARFARQWGLPDPGPCHTASGEVISPYEQRFWTIEHVKDELGMSIRADDDPAHAVTVCWGHHVFWRQWSTSKIVREKVREYLAGRLGR